jgi:hypothetical protein
MVGLVVVLVLRVLVLRVLVLRVLVLRVLVLVAVVVRPMTRGPNIESLSAELLEDPALPVEVMVLRVPFSSLLCVSLVYHEYLLRRFASVSASVSVSVCEEPYIILRDINR